MLVPFSATCYPTVRTYNYNSANITIDTTFYYCPTYIYITSLNPASIG